MDYKNNYKKWMNNEKIDKKTRNELIDIYDKDSEIKERFYKSLEFGTGGLRGIMGAGTNRINIYTLRRVTQGLANFINSSRLTNTNSSVAIAYDSRYHSEKFAEEVALVLAANNIKAYVFESLRPTPELSFAVRHLNCEAGIVITASHNPPEYNGYKIYGIDGGQVTLGVANTIISEVEKLDIFDDINTCSREDAIKKDLFSYIGKDIDYEYLDRITKLSVYPELSNKVDNFKIVYTPLHGSGLKSIEQALSMLGYKDLHIVESQKEPDGSFPTVKSPNPEEREALSEGIRLAKKINADIVLGTDPDADRVGVAVKSRDSKYVLLSGNQIGALLTQYLVSNKTDINYKDAVIKTIVTSELGANIAKKNGATVFNTLTGFKFIGEKIKEFEENNNYNFLFGYEESYGFLMGTFVRDKDAVISSILIVEMTAYYKLHGMTLLDVIDNIYKEYGYYTDALESYTFKEIDGQKKINSIVDKFRNYDTLIKEIKNINIIEDYKSQKKYNTLTTQTEIIELPSTNLIKIHFIDESWFAIRPSGTEPKLKIYYSVIDIDKKSSSLKMEKIKKMVKDLAEL